MRAGGQRARSVDARSDRYARVGYRMTGMRPERSAGLEIERHRTPTPRRRQADPPAAPRSRWWPARLGVAIKEPPRVRLSILGLGRVSVAVRHSILPNRQRQAAPARLAARYTGRAPRPDDHGRGIEPAWHTRPTSYLAPTKPVNTRLKSLQPAKA
jgi:hypothetical protein